MINVAPSGIVLHLPVRSLTGLMRVLHTLDKRRIGSNASILVGNLARRILARRERVE